MRCSDWLANPEVLAHIERIGGGLCATVILVVYFWRMR
jgi:hypothetical protein